MKNSFLILWVAIFLTSIVTGCSSGGKVNHLLNSDEPNKNNLHYDVLLLNGTIVDGTGSPRYQGDVAILNGRIAAIGELKESSAVEVVDISGLVLAPGFIDTHSHADIALDNSATAGIDGFLLQGVTTALYGVDGSMSAERIRTHTRLGENGGMGINFMSYIGHNAVRRKAMGIDNRLPSSTEMEQMKAHVNEAMQLGAVGLSTGLMYLPGNYATTDEVIELVKVTAPYGALYDSHVRDPVNNLLNSHQECLDIAYAGQVDAHPGHIKAVGANNFGKGADIVDLINAGIDRGQNVTVDLYPYDGAATLWVTRVLHPASDNRGKEMLSQLLPVQHDISPSLDVDIQSYWRDISQSSDLVAQAQANTERPPEGVFSWVQTVGYASMRIVESSNKAYVGRMVTDLADELGISPFELLLRLIVNDGNKSMVTLGAIQEEDIQVIMKQPWAMISSDGREISVNHPRDRGSFPRVLGRYVRDWGVLTLEEGVHKISGLPASYLKLSDRGVIQEGNIADITVFDPNTIIDKSTWSQPELYSEGIVHVLINGKFALRNSEVSEKRFGRFIPFTSNR